ncbi:hypothetical protein BDY17DRAFT_293522 [Neohortaea acidophila]|uniref:Uncharacterized protein n=1 Tax=Neohortaea acidophila TaxID=245834 RepID=A0A6A6Q094_9PEZI|nr:uncharacterized protein BDY17DRAFT_293522 [Neohortaea acidophila]KAF2485399.1 hypothetical protein BDY17DRAFT_293522 [Neohortaea acidophila]
MNIEQHDTNASGLPRIPLDLTRHKLSIALHWLPIILTSCILPIVGYFALRYGSEDLQLRIILSPWLALMGVVSLYSLLTRSWALIRRDSTCRPLAQTSRWGMDFFGWNFVFGFLMLTALISAGISTQNLTVVSLPTSVLMLYVCFELVLVQVIMAMGLQAPIRFSSIQKGSAVRPGTYVICEDIVAVDGKRGQAFRQAWNDRYEASAVFRLHLRRMDLLWGISGLAIVAIIWGLVFGLSDTRVKREIVYSIGERS